MKSKSRSRKFTLKMGCYVSEYELKGADRAEYGKYLLSRLAGELQKSIDRCYSERYIRLCRQFYQTYPQIRKSVISELPDQGKGKSLISKFNLLSEGRDESKTDSESHTAINPAHLIERLSFTHIIELLKCDDGTKRTFYEIECILGNWSVRELKRQINSLYYERSGLSRDKKKLSKIVHQGAESAEPALTIRDPYIFEFLGLKPAEVMSESLLEEQLLNKLQDFLLELGQGFCFEARQKRILIGDTHYFIDLVFYHRILKCHVLIELKMEEFSHENIGQLNTYVSWYRKNMMTADDNPTIGILLCTQKNRSLVEYALAGMDNRLFVSKYLLELPKKEDMEKFVDEIITDAIF
ncbi:YhcG family protein [candidate division CSSED10-310 bacterium]|uniref:YhcG family protein n=1 Tax=candidate division CSSED10-310 bacterium TaxID=2855610 RepID=A0ABV6YXF6_UNCC1